MTLAAETRACGVSEFARCGRLADKRFDVFDGASFKLDATSVLEKLRPALPARIVDERNEHSHPTEPAEYALQVADEALGSIDSRLAGVITRLDHQSDRLLLGAAVKHSNPSE
jgi:hypothetical protein